MSENLNPFGTPPAEDTVNFPIPSEDEDPYRPIGKYDDAGKPIAGYEQKCETTGKCVSVKTGLGPSGYPMVSLSFVVTEGNFAGREFDLHCSYSPKARFKIVETYKAIGLPLDRPFQKSEAIGVYVIMHLADEEYQGRWSAKLQRVAPHQKGAGYRGTADLAGIGQVNQKAVAADNDIPF